jgi:hypothetical protein
MIDTNERHTKNPFLEDYKTSEAITKIKDSGLSLTDQKGKVVDDVKVVYAAETLRDREPYVKVYMNNLMILDALNKQGTRMFIYICEHSTIDRDDIRLNYESYRDWYTVYFNEKFWKSAYQTALKNLLENYVICKSNLKGLFYINPSIIFKGQRWKLRSLDNSRSVSIRGINSLTIGEKEGEV